MALVVVAAFFGAALPAAGFFWAGCALLSALPGTLSALRAAAKDGVATAPPSTSPPMTAATIARRICPPVLRSVVRRAFSLIPHHEEEKVHSAMHYCLFWP